MQPNLLGNDVLHGGLEDLSRPGCLADQGSLGIDHTDKHQGLGRSREFFVSEIRQYAIAVYAGQLVLVFPKTSKAILKSLNVSRHWITQQPRKFLCGRFRHWTFSSIREPETCPLDPAYIHRPPLRALTRAHRFLNRFNLAAGAMPILNHNC
jgi:hypothetical protein